MYAETAADLDRHLTFRTVFNFRDLGGYETSDRRVTKWRSLFRADGIHRLTFADLAPLDIRTVIDLRTPAEVEDRGRFDHHEVGYHHLPILKTTWERAALDLGGPPERFLADRYLEMLEEGRDEIGRVLRLVGQADSAPLVFHCAAGKDRTGVVAALTLGLLGIPDETIVADYALSRQATAQWIEWLKAEYPDKVADIDSQPTAFMDSPAEAMQLFLADLEERYGSLVGYAASAGVDEDTIAGLRASLLEPRSA